MEATKINNFFDAVVTEAEKAIKIQFVFKNNKKTLIFGGKAKDVIDLIHIAIRASTECRELVNARVYSTEETYVSIAY